METREDVENVASSIQENLNINDGEIPKGLLQKLQLLRCPFTWDMPNESTDVKNAIKEAKLKEKYFTSVSSPLICCFEYAKQGDLNQALKVLRDWNADKRLDQFLKLEVASSDSEDGDEAKVVDNAEGCEPFLRKVPYVYVFDSCECFILYKLKHFKECEEKLKNIECFENLSCDVQAVVYWLQAVVILEYGYEGQKHAIGIVEDALKLDPKSIRLQVLLGKLLGRVRRVEDRCAVPDLREITVLENALRESYDHRTAVHLALVYRESSRNLQRSSKAQDSDTREIIDDMYSKATELYSKAFEEHENDYFVATRVAEGFTRLPPPWRDLRRAQVCLRQALSICEEDPYLNHIAGTLYTKKGDLGKAKYFLTLASDGMTRNYGACMDLILIKQQVDPQYNPVSDLESLLDHIKDEPLVEDILCNLGAFFYVEMRNFEKAFGYWEKVIERNIHSRRLKSVYCRLIKPTNVNINEIIIYELQKKIDENVCSDEEKTILDKLLTLYPNLKGSYVERNRFDDAGSSYLSRSRWGNSRSDNRSTAWKDVYWWKKKPLSAAENDQEGGINSSRRPTSNSDSSDSFNWRRQPSSTRNSAEASANDERTAYYRPGSRFERSYESGSQRRDFGSSSTGAEGHSTRGSFWRHEESSSRSSESENWRSRPAGRPEDTKK